MSLQFSVPVRDARLDAFETVAGVSPLLRIFNGPPPADCAAADSGTKLVEIALPADWMSAASGGTKLKNGTWSALGIAAGTAAHFRIKDSTGTDCHVQGTITGLAGGGDMTLTDGVHVAVNQVVTVNTFTLNEGNA